ncbi:bifunctional Multiple myeloma tumor-associated protein 2-like [Babesia duncani]|uniref:Bifunctional Multiple myeloma tumor-associated protein 2-like n=1 Tax=Babesia duncani TaxID=323732 RepID=A0AAD9UM43_9APIC|nr:bifunctional Multiple myeloma tumor-associated protein 2-like [Babesia duncani]KAK2194702.1 bifunctional Multiple myeloma tumor-associated protein 2-like [Babesia duncani]KAK2197985.1 bifunctional Multiple myeloma tumor-associated protein 2-like [Babesia duncani]
MIDIKLSPPREGTRGGREHFKWEDLKGQSSNERDYYLGNSVKIGQLKRRDKFYKHDWYLKPESKDSTENVMDEIELIKLYEKQVMEEVLGTRPKKLTLLKERPTRVEELRALLADSEPKLEDTAPISQPSRHSRSRKGRSRSRSRDHHRKRSTSRSNSRRHRTSRHRNRHYHKSSSKHRHSLDAKRDRGPRR